MDKPGRMRQGQVGRRRGTTALVLTACLGLLALALPAGAHTGTTHPAYPNHGWAWLAEYPDNAAGMWVRSERCNTTGLGAAFSAMRATTSGSKSEFRGKWPSGIAPTETSCGSVFDYSVDIILDWMTDSEWTAAGHGDFGGHVHSYVADEQYCDYYQFTKYDPDGPPPNGGPKGNIACGLHGSRMHVKTSRYLGYSSDTTRRNFLIHELGHSYGFIDYCGDDNRVTNNTGAAGCSLPAGWGSVDRQEMRDHIYPSGSY